MRALKPLLKTYCKCSPVQGGMFVWLQVQHGEPMLIAKTLLKESVAVVPSDVFYKEPKNALPALRLNFSHSCEADLRTAVERMTNVIEKMLR